MDKVSQIQQLIDERADAICALNDQVWSTPELGFKEYKSAAAISEYLKAEGFTVEMGLAGMPTAFKATFGSGHPVIALLGEFDALPSLSQKAGCNVHTPLEENGHGHGCGHCALGSGSAGAAVAAKEYMTAHGLTGTIAYFGCPAEETGCGKMFMVKDGCFDDVDAAFTWHPSNTNSVWGFSSLANNCVYYRFKGKTAHAAAAPHLGRSALDACELMNVGVNYLREHVISSARIHYAYHDVGGPAPNVVQDHACLFYYIRAPKISEALEIKERVNECARGAAIMTGTDYEVQISSGLCDYQPNDVLSKLLADCFQRTGAPAFDEQDKALAQSFMDNFSEGEILSSIESIRGLYGQEAYEKYAKAPLVEEVADYAHTTDVLPGSTDVGDVSRKVPTAQLGAACYANGTPGHTWQLAAQVGSSLGHKGLLAAAKAMALATVCCLENPEIVKAAKEEHDRVLGPYVCPVPLDLKPDIDMEA